MFGFLKKTEVTDDGCKFEYNEEINTNEPEIKEEPKEKKIATTEKPNHQMRKKSQMVTEEYYKNVKQIVESFGGKNYKSIAKVASCCSETARRIANTRDFAEYQALVAKYSAISRKQKSERTGRTIEPRNFSDDRRNVQKNNKTKKNGYKYVDQELFDKIKEYANNGMTTKNIVKLTGSSITTVSRIRPCKTLEEYTRKMAEMHVSREGKGGATGKIRQAATATAKSEPVATKFSIDTLETCLSEELKALEKAIEQYRQETSQKNLTHIAESTEQFERAYIQLSIAKQLLK